MLLWQPAYGAQNLIFLRNTFIFKLKKPPHDRKCKNFNEKYQNIILKTKLFKFVKKIA